ncbi:hypothetical protein J4402_03395 [Candidatus Pacearchaeota archaeon]|nr:hypothetical protein [Candidatus Pacearchaeota archaeon]
MGNFKSNNRGGFGNRSGGRSFGGSSRGRGGFGGGFGGGRDFGRRNTEMHDAVCAKCGKQCQIPFRPTGDKPVFCSDCFRQNEGSRNNSSQSGASSEQMKQINAKLDKILLILQDLELDTDDDFDEEEEDLDEEDEDDSEADL